MSLTLSAWVQQRTAWLVLAPPIFMVGLRSVLELLASREPQMLALPLTPVSIPGSLLGLLWPGLALLTALVLVILTLLKLGWRRVVPSVALVWVLLWLAGSATLIQRHLNQLDLQALPDVVAQTLTLQFKPPSSRGPGGTQLYLQVPGMPVPHTVLIDDPQVATLRPGDTLSLSLAQGRFSGFFVTAWQIRPNLPESSL